MPLQQKQNILKYGILPQYSTVLTSETTAIIKAIEIIKNRKGKFIICSDSLAAIDSIQNSNNNNLSNLKVHLNSESNP